MKVLLSEEIWKQTQGIAAGVIPWRLVRNNVSLSPRNVGETNLDKPMPATIYCLCRNWIINAILIRCYAYDWS